MARTSLNIKAELCRGHLVLLVVVWRLTLTGLVLLSLIWEVLSRIDGGFNDLLMHAFSILAFLLCVLSAICGLWVLLDFD